MYRTYENPFALQTMLVELETEYRNAIERGVDLEDLIDLAIDIESTKQRINFAWQDDEYDAYCY